MEDIMAPVADHRTTDFKAGKDTRIGALLVAWGRLLETNVDAILARQEAGGGTFGEIARTMGLIAESDVEAVLQHQAVHRPVGVHNVVWPRELIAARPSAETDVEVFRALRLQLLKRWFSLGHSSLAFVSPDPDVGLSFFVANLALVFAHAHQSTLLIDANLRMPSQHTIFKIDDAIGLADVLSSGKIVECAPRHTAFRDLSLLVAGNPPADPYELLSSNAFSTLAGRLSARFNITLIDLSPFKAGAEALAVAAEVGGAVLVTRRHQSRVADVVAIETALRSVGSQLVGSVLLDF
jgi:chain length determinant protein tyrosine kinase EpsG